MNKSWIYKISYLYLVLMDYALIAQTHSTLQDDLPSGVVEVIKPYEPVLADAKKISIAPILPTESIPEKPSFSDYNVPVRFLQMQFTPPKIKPIAIKDDTRKDLDELWVKLGFGNKTTPLADVQWSKTMGERGSGGIHLSHISSREKESLRDFSSTAGSIFGTRAGDKNVIEGIINFDHDMTQFYGTHTDSTWGDLDTIRFLRKKFNNAALHLTLHQKENKMKGLRYLIGADPYYYWINNAQKELGIGIDIAGHYHLLSGIYMGIESYMDYQSISEKPMGQKDMLYQIIPELGIRKNFGHLRLGLDILQIKDGSLNLWPDLLAEIPVLNKKLSFYGGWNKKAMDNSLRTLNNQNPFLGNSHTTENGDIAYVVITDQVNENRFAGLLFNLGGKFQGDVGIKQIIAKEQPFYFPSTSDTARFTLRYGDRFSHLSPSLKINYQINQHSIIGANFAYHILDTRSMEFALYTPKMEAGIRFSSLIADRLQLFSAFILLTGLRGIDANMQEKKLKTVPDLNFEARYRIIPPLSVFCMANNLFSTQYSRYLNYPVYGIRVIGGLLLQL